MPNDTNKVNKIAEYINHISSTEEAMAAAKRGYQIADSLDFTLGRIRCIHHMGNIYINMGDYQNAMETFLWEQSAVEETGNSLRMSSVYNGLGNACSGLGNDSAALHYYKLGLQLVDNGNPDIIGRCEVFLNNIGSIYAERGEYDSAIFYFRKSIAIAERVPGSNKYYTASCYEGIGDIYTERIQYDSAIIYYDKARKYFEMLGLLQRIAGVMNSVSNLYMQRGEFDRAIDSLHAALGYAAGANKVRHSIYGTLAKAYAAKGEYQSAFNYQEKFSKLSDTILNEESINAMNEMMTKYETVKKDKEIAEKNAENKAREMERNIITGGFGVMLLLALVIFRSYRQKKKSHDIIEVQKREVESQKVQIEGKNKEILDSINYAKRIQYTLLAQDELLLQNLPEHFVYFNPKDIVSGDFYWGTSTTDSFYLAVCDSTGHGVPGAFMSLLNISFLNEAINEKKILSPEKILGYVRERLIGSVSKEGAQDGMDAILIRFNRMSNEITYAAANNTPVVVVNDESIQLPYDKMPVGKGPKELPFSLHTIPRSQGAVLYLSTDGFADQFGGEKGKKFRSKNLHAVFAGMYKKPMPLQLEDLRNVFDSWKGRLDQVDDICTIGIRL